MKRRIVNRLTLLPITFGILLLASCDRLPPPSTGGQVDAMHVYSLGATDPFVEDLGCEVAGADPRRLALSSIEGERINVELLSDWTSSNPGVESFVALLRDRDGHVVDRRTEVLGNQIGLDLHAGLFDVNGDGVMALCFMRHVSWPEQGSSYCDDELLAAYRVAKSRFDPATVPQLKRFHVRFEETRTEDGLVIQPALKGDSEWVADTSYTVPVRLVNRGTRPIKLRGAYLDVHELGIIRQEPTERLDRDDLRPGESIATVAAVRWWYRTHERECRFRLARPVFEIGNAGEKAKMQN